MKQRLSGVGGVGARLLAFTALRGEQCFERRYKKGQDWKRTIGYALRGILETYSFASDPRMLELVRTHDQDAV